MLLGGGDPVVVARCFERALADAQSQGALFLVLRAATSLALLHEEEGLASDPVSYLRAAYEAFPEGLETPELRDARALLATAS
jgi:hypothetical protein